MIGLPDPTKDWPPPSSRVDESVYWNFGNPTGVGLYMRGLSKEKHGTPAQAAKKAKDNGVSFVAIMAAWQDIHNGKERFLYSNGRDPERIVRYAEAFLNAGVKPWIWGFPRAGGEHQYINRMCDVSTRSKVIQGWLHDPELFYKWSAKARWAPSGMRGQAEYTGKAEAPKGSKQIREIAAMRLMDLTEESRQNGLIRAYGVTSYGMAQYHKNFPWKQFSVKGFGSPQLYSVTPEQVDQGIAAWRAHGWTHIVPSVPLFGKMSGAHLHDHLSNFVDGEEDISGLLFWSWRQASRDEWRVMARWAEWLDAGMCVG